MRSRKRQRWRDYQTASGARPVKAFIDQLTDEEAAAVVAGMNDVAVHGLERARHKGLFRSTDDGATWTHVSRGGGLGC